MKPEGGRQPAPQPGAASLQNPDSARPITLFVLDEDDNTAWSNGALAGPGWNDATLNLSEFTDWLVANATVFRFNPAWYIGAS